MLSLQGIQQLLYFRQQHTYVCTYVAVKKFPTFYSARDFHCLVHKSPLIVPDLSHINPLLPHSFFFVGGGVTNWTCKFYTHMTVHHNKFLYNKTRYYSKAVYKPVWHIPLLSVQWINSWWWAEELSETCRVSWQNKFVKLLHLVGFIIKERANIGIYFRIYKL